MHIPLVFSSIFFLLSTQGSASGLYPKNSPVLQVDARSYDKLIAKSNYTSIVEFYAPWCGHCKNLKPAYEKAASALSGYAKVAAIDCDDDANKPFCGGMGVQGFPTLKIVKPSKKGGKPIVEDYNGARTAKAISDVITDKIPNHVTRLKDADVNGWLKKSERPKVVFFTEKGTVSSLVKALAIDFLGAIDVAQIRSSEKEATGKFMVEAFPQAYVVPGVDVAPEKYDGELKKAPLKTFLTKFATPNPEFPSTLPKAKASSAKKDDKQKPKTGAKKDSGAKEASCPAGHKGKNPHTPPSNKVKEESNPTESPDPNVASDKPAPVEVPVEPAQPLEVLASEEAFVKSCLNANLGTVVLAILSPSADDDASALAGLTEIAHKHALRRAKMFPFYSVPSTNAAGQSLITKLGVKSAADVPAVVLAVNSKRGWWTQYGGSDLGREGLETWIDNIRFGDFKKGKLPEGVVTEVEETATKAAAAEPTEDSADHDEL